MARPGSLLAVAPLFGLALLFSGCAYLPFGGAPAFDADVATARRAADAQVLRDPQSGAVLLASAAFDGRVLGSAFAEDEETLGWFDRRRVRAGPGEGGDVGGEDSSSLVFLGAQPPSVAGGTWAMSGKSDTALRFRRDLEVADAAGRTSHLRLERRVSLLSDSAELNQALSSVVPVRLRILGYRTETTLTHRGGAPWPADASAPALRGVTAWPASARLRVILPLDAEPRLDALPLGSGRPLAPDRLRLGARALFFRGDGRAVGPVGVVPRSTPSVLGAWDAERAVLTVVRFSSGEGPRDAAPVVLGGRGGACEVATYSPRCELAPGGVMSLRRTTVHLTGPWRDLDVVARNVLGVGLAEAEAALP